MTPTQLSCCTIRLLLQIRGSPRHCPGSVGPALVRRRRTKLLPRIIGENWPSAEMATGTPVSTFQALRRKRGRESFSGGNDRRGRSLGSAVAPNSSGPAPKHPLRSLSVGVSGRGACHLSLGERSSSQGRERVLGRAALLMDTFRTERLDSVGQFDRKVIAAGLHVPRQRRPIGILILCRNRQIGRLRRWRSWRQLLRARRLEGDLVVPQRQ